MHRPLLSTPSLPLTLLPLLALLAFLVGAFFQLHATSADAPTSDEAVHLAAGTSSLLTHDRRLNPEHPPLLKSLAALPVLLLQPSLPIPSRAWTERNQWTFAEHFLFHNRIPAERLLQVGRGVPTLLALLTPLLLALLARMLYGPSAGFIVLILASLEPTLLGHGHLVTTDVPLACASTSTLLVWLTLLRRVDDLPSDVSPRVWPLVPLAMLLGCGLASALLIKYSGGILAVTLLGLFGWEVYRIRAVPFRVRTWTLLGGVTVITVWGAAAACYGQEPLTAWWNGYGHRQAGWHQYLWGEISTEGWYSYFLQAVLLKTPPSTLLLGLWGALSLRRTPLLRGEGAVLLFAGTFFCVASAARIGIGIRHILPVTLLLLVWVARAAPLLREGRRPKLWYALLAVSVLESLVALPTPLSYGSSLIGGPQALHRALSDSNLDWGQELYRLRDWARVHAPQGLVAGVFSGVPVEQAGVPLLPLPAFGGQTFRERPMQTLPIQPDGTLYVAMSALNLQGVYFTPQGPFGQVPGISPGLYRFLLERPPTVRLTPSIWIWELSQDRDALLTLAGICERFGWRQTAALLGQQAVGLPGR